MVWSLPPESASEIERKRREDEQAESDFGQAEAAAGGTAEHEAAAAFAFDDRPARVAIIGRPNVGKSSLLNSLLGEERAIVSDVPGTTRDAIDTAFEWAGRTVRLVDTAGIRRRGKVASGPAAERFATLRALKAVSRADVTVLVLDAQDGLTTQDEHVAGYALEEGTGLVVVINKWDLVEPTKSSLRRIRRAHAPPGSVPGLRAHPGDQRQDRSARRVGRSRRPWRSPPSAGAGCPRRRSTPGCAR